MSEDGGDGDHDDGALGADWTKEQVRDLMVRSKGYQAATYLSSGYPPDLKFQKYMQEIKEEEKRKKRATQRNEQAPMTRTRKTTIESPDGVICKEESVQIDHSAIRYATTINIRTGVNQYIPVKEDTGTDFNWITQELAERLALHIRDAPAGIRFKDFHGNEFEAKHRVTLPLVGEKDKSQHAECFITPVGFPFDCVLVGSAFVNEVGPPHELFAEKPKGTAFVMVQTPLTEAEKLSMAAAEISAEAKAAALAREREQRMKAKNGLASPVQPPPLTSSSSSSSVPSSLSSGQKSGRGDSQGSQLGS